MALKDLLKATTYDRYTQDGRDKLNEALAEDVRYKTGDISQKTGLQKQPDGSWAPPKKGGAPKKAEPKPGRDTPLLKNKDHVDLAKEVKSNTMPGSDWTAEEIAKEWKLGKADAEEVKKEFDKIKESKPTGAIEKYKNLPGPQKKDALFAAAYEGSSIGMTQNGMERNGWDLIEADDTTNVYAKPDGSKVTMKHDGKKITETNYQAPEDKSEMRISSFMDKYLKGKSNRESNNFYDFVKRKIYQSGEEPQKYLGQSGYSYPTQKLKEYLNEWQSQDAAPRELTGDCKIRLRRG